MLAGQIVKRARIELVEVEEPRLASPGEIIFQPEIACLCGSDLPFFDGSHIEYPLPPGLSLHEMVGTVVETSGERFRAGDRVLAVPLDQTGFFERYALSDERAIPLDPRKPPEIAMMAQPLGTAIYALKKLPPLLDLDVVIVGQGPMGQLFTSAVRNLGARQIIAVEPVAERRERSPGRGATATIDPAREDPVAAVARLTGGAMADVVIEAVGHHEQALALSIDLCRHKGRILYFGVPDGNLDDVPWRALFFKNITVDTSVNPDFTREFPLAMRWICEDRIEVASLQTHRFPVTRIQEAFELFRDRREGAQKVVIDFPR